MQYGFGLSFSNLKNADQDTSNNAEYKPLVGINLSFSSISNLNERISLVSEFAYSGIDSISLGALDGPDGMIYTKQDYISDSLQQLHSI